LDFFKNHWLGVFISGVLASLAAAYLFEMFHHASPPTLDARTVSPSSASTTQQGTQAAPVERAPAVPTPVTLNKETAGPIERPEPEASQQTPVPPAPSLANTTWQGQATGGPTTMAMVITFAADGSLGVMGNDGRGDNQFTRFDNSHWTQNGTHVDLYINDNYSVMSGDIQGRTISGTVKAQGGMEGQFSMSRTD